jgi:tetratricopeptide (TPR) repeat protein
MVAITEFFLIRKEPAQRLVAAIKRALPYAALGVLLGLWIVLMRPESGNESRGYSSSWEYFMTQWRAYLYYMRIWFWPWDFNADNASMEFTRSIKEPLAIQALIGNLFVLAVAWFNRKRYPALAYGVVWFYVTISPASSVVVLAEAINEHRMYLAYIGFVGGTFTVLLAAAEGLFAAETRARRLGWVYALMVVGLVIGTQERNRVWANDENLWLDTVEKNPTSGRALNNLALVYLGRGEYQKAVGYFEKCEQYWSTYLYCPLNLGISYRALGSAAEKDGKKEEARQLNEKSERSLARAFQLNPRNVHVNFHLGTFLEEVKKDCAKAVDHYRTAVELTGWRYPSADLKLGGCLLKLKRGEEARVAFDRAVAVEPGNSGLLFDRGRIELEAQDLEAAARTYRALVETAQGNVQAWYNLGVAQVGLQRFEEAKGSFLKTVTLDPRSEQGWYNLAFVQERLGDAASALASVKRLVEINPGKTEYQVRLKELQSRAAPGRS